MTRIPGRLELLTRRRADREDRRTGFERDGAASRLGIGNGDDAAGADLVLLIVEREPRASVADEVELLVARMRLVVVAQQLVAGSPRDVHVDAERGQAEVMLERVPVRVTRLVRVDARD